MLLYLSVSDQELLFKKFFRYINYLSKNFIKMVQNFILINIKISAIIYFLNEL